MKAIGNIIKPGIRYALQKSIAEKKFPTQCKRAKLKYTFQKSEDWNRENYRSISLLCLLSRLMKGQVFHQLDSHLKVAGFKSHSSKSMGLQEWLQQSAKFSISYMYALKLQFWHHRIQIAPELIKMICQLHLILCISFSDTLSEISAYLTCILSLQIFFIGVYSYVIILCCVFLTLTRFLPYQQPLWNY